MIRWTIQASLLGVLLFGSYGAPSQESAWPTSIRIPQGPARDKIINAAFPRLNASANDGFTEIVVMFSPTSHPESQLEVAARPGSPVRLRYIHATVRFEDAVVRAAAHGDSSDDAIVKAMRLENRAFTRPPEYRDELVRGFWDAMAGSTAAITRRALGNLEQLDGTEYKIYMRSGSAEVSLTLQDDEVGTPNRTERLQIVRWMNGLWRESESRFERVSGHGQ